MSATTIVWKTKSLEELTERIDYGHTASADTAVVGPKFLRITDIQNGHVNWDTVPYCPATPDEIDKYRLFDGDIVFARTGNTTGKSFLLKHPPKDSVFASYLIRVRPSHEVDSRFLAHFFDTPNYWNQIKKNAQGAGQPGVNASRLKTLEIPLPPQSEQKRIADILDKADAIRRKRQKAQKHASDLFTAAFIDRFGDPVTNPKNWERVQLPLITKRITVGIVVKPASYYVDEGVPALRSLNVRVNRIEKENFVFFSEKDNEGPLSKTRVWKDDVLLVRSGQPGTAAVVPEDLNGVNAIDVLIVTPDLERVTSQYLCYLFNSPAGKRLVLGEERGQIQKHLNVSSLKKLEVPLPPIGEQRDFNRFLAVTASMQAHLAEASGTVDALFNSLVQRAFKGEL